MASAAARLPPSALRAVARTRRGSSSAASAGRSSGPRPQPRRRCRRPTPSPSASSSRCCSPTWSASPSASEARDAEDTRELLSRYFETCQRLISLYGGTVEKFIGDAVMAVWGTPVANEDDAERAVRTALDLVAAVPELGAGPRPRAAGVLTGEAAVTLGRRGQGMVAGDLVNTASRIQSAAEPGTVLVGEATRRATEAAIAYEAAGEHELKGKAEPVALYRALRVTAGPRRRAEVGRPRAAVRRPRPRAAPGQGALPRVGRGGQGAARLGRRHRRDRQVAPRLGVREVRRRARRQLLVAPRPLPRLRRRRRLLGARRDGADARGDRRGGGARARARQAPRLDRRSTSPTRRSGAGSSRGSRTCSASPSGPRPTGRISSPPGGSSSSGSPTQGRWCSSSRTSSGRTPACSTSSSTCSSGRATTRCSCSRSPGRSCSSAGPTFGASGRNATTLSLEPLSARRDGAAARRLRARAARRAARRRSSTAPRASRSTRSRRCGCCSTAACSPARATSTGRPGRSERSTCPRRSTRSSPRGWTASSPRSGVCSRTPRCWASRSPRPALRRYPGWPSRGARAARHLARPQGGALRAGRPALARARPVQLPPGPAQARRVRDARRRPSARPATSPPPLISRRPSVPGSRRSSRWSPPTTSTRTGRRPTPTTRRRSRPGRRRCLPVQASAPPHSPRTTRPQHYFEQAAELSDDPTRRGATARAGRRDGVGVRSGGGGARSLRACARAVRGGGVDASGGAGHCSAR